MPVWFSCLISIVGVLVPSLALVSNLRHANDEKKDEEARKVANDALINFKLDTISNDIKSVKYDVSATKEDVRNLSERLSKVEASAQSAHKRIDEVVYSRKGN